MFWVFILLIGFMYFVNYRMGKRKFEEFSKKLPSGFKKWPLLGHSYMFAGNDEGFIISREGCRNYYYSLYTSHCWAQASSHHETVWAIVPTRAQCGLGTSHAPLNYFADACRFSHEKLSDIMTTIQKFSRAAVDRGGVVSMKLGQEHLAVVADPAPAELLLKSCLGKHEHTTSVLKFIVGNGSIYAPVSTWRPRRKLLAPTFNINKLNRFVDVFANQSSILVEMLRPAVDNGTFSIWKYLTKYTFDSVCETTLGVRMNAQGSPSHSFLEALDKSTELIAQRSVKPWLQPNWIYRFCPQYKVAEKCRNEMYEFIDEVIKSKRKEMETKQRVPGYTPKSGNDEWISDKLSKDSFLGFQSLLEMLLETSLKVKGFSDVELREETLVMSAAGTDTSAVGACFTLLMLARHPEIQEKVAEELHEVLDFGDKCVTAADLPRLKYLEAVIKETMRMYPPVPLITRKPNDDVELQSGITLPKGTGLLISIWAIHRNPRYWGADAEEFKPERFFQPLTHAGQFLPFSYGLRNCLGYKYAMMSMKTVLATILRQYRVLPPKGMDEKALKAPIRVKFDIMMKDVDKFQVQLENRSTRISRKIG